MQIDQSVSCPVAGQDRTFTYTFRSARILASAVELDKFLEMNSYEQIPLVLFAGLMFDPAANSLPEDFSPETMERWMMTMDSDQLAEVSDYGLTALGFILGTMVKYVVRSQKPAESEKPNSRKGQKAGKAS